MEWTDILSLGSNPFQVFALILRNGGLIIFYPVLLWMCYRGWMTWVQNKYQSKIQWVLLAIDVPKLNEQSMAAVERIMESLHGVAFSPTKRDRYWVGAVSDSFSLEIISIDGYIQYFVRCANYNVELVKGAFYGAYPDAEIVEVEDYIDNMPKRFPNKQDVDMWGTEFILAKPDVYPLKTYEFFEHSLSGLFADPMAGMLELLSRLKPGEQVWIQIIITPEIHTWRERGLKEVAGLIDKKMPSQKDMFDRVVDLTRGTLETVHDAIWTVETSGAGAAIDKKNEMGNWMSMTTGEKTVVEEIQKKIARIGFKTKIRFCYLAPKDAMGTYRVVGSVIGALKQFSTLDCNAFTIGRHLITSRPTYGLVNWRRNQRKRKLILGYRNRSNNTGETAYVLSTTEIATLYHFPTELVKAPLVAKTAAKKAEPPARLPVEQTPFEALRRGHQHIIVPAIESVPEAIAEAAPANLPGANVKISGTTVPTPPPPLPPEDRPQAGPPPAPTAYTPPPPLPQPAPAATPVTTQPPITEYPLHSMPGLPPGVHPVRPTSPAEAPPQIPTPPPIRGGQTPPNLPT